MSDQPRYSKRETAFILAGLRTYQQIDAGYGIPDCSDILHGFEPMQTEEYDQLCEKINSGEHAEYCVVVTGNVISGVSIVGPFMDHEAALDWTRDLVDDDWHVAPLDDPGED